MLAKSITEMHDAQDSTQRLCDRGRGIALNLMAQFDLICGRDLGNGAWLDCR